RPRGVRTWSKIKASPAPFECPFMRRGGRFDFEFALTDSLTDFLADFFVGCFAILDFLTLGFALARVPAFAFGAFFRFALVISFPSANSGAASRSISLPAAALQQEPLLDDFGRALKFGDCLVNIETLRLQSRDLFAEAS